MHSDFLITLAFVIADWMIRIGLSVRVIMRRLPVGVSLAWLAVILVFPYLGALLYLLFGELRLGRRRERVPRRFALQGSRSTPGWRRTAVSIGRCAGPSANRSRGLRNDCWAIRRWPAIRWNCSRTPKPCFVR